jgi:mycoredoxin
LKKPIFIIFLLFISAYFLLSQFERQQYSTEPVILSKSSSPDIIMFGSQNCHYCTVARSFFRHHKLSYVENDIDISEKHRQMFYLMGGQGTPLIIVNKQLIHGFDEKRIRDAL